MGKKNPKSEEKKVRASDFSNFHTSDSRPTGLHQIFASFNNIAPLERNVSIKSDSTVLTKAAKTPDEPFQNHSDSQADVLALLNKLTKKDSVTKLKALETFNEIMEDIPEQVLEEFVVDLIHLFKKSAVVEPSKKIRLEFGKLLSKIANKLKKRLQHYLASFITQWWISMHDESQEISEAYVEAFRNLFTSTLSNEEFEIKTLKILNFYFTRISSDYLELFNRDMDSFSKEWLDTFGKASQNSASTADMHNRLFYSISHSLMKLFVYLRVHRGETEFPLSEIVNSEFVDKTTEMIRSASFRKKLSCLMMLVEMVKVLPKEGHHLMEKIISNSITCVKTDTEPALLYHNVRLIVACTREDKGCMSKFLSDYDRVVISVLKNFNGEYRNKVDLYTLFPSLYMYLDPEYFTVHRESFEKVLKFLCEIMEEEGSSLKRNAYTFDLELYRSFGTRMLYSYYKLLLLSSTKSCEYILLPLKHLLPVTENSRDFLWNYAPALTEYVSEADLVEEGCFAELLDELVALSEDSTLLVFSVMDSLKTKYEDKMKQVYPKFEEVYKDLLEKLSKSLPESLERHLEHREDLRVDVSQMVQLLKKTNLSLPKHIPILLLKSHSHPDFLEDYKMLLDVYRTLRPSEVVEAVGEDLEDNLLLFYSIALLGSDRRSQDRVLSKKFDLSDRCTSFLVFEFLNGCRDFRLSNELVQFSKWHLSLESMSKIFEIVDYKELNKENKVIYQILSLTYQLYESRELDLEEYDEGVAEGVLKAHLCQVLRKKVSDFKRFSSFLLEEVEFSREGVFPANEESMKRLESLPSSSLTEYQSFTKGLGTLLGSLFKPTLVTEALEKAIELIEGVYIKKLKERSYYLVVNAYLKSEDKLTEVEVDRFLRTFIKALVSRGQLFCATAHEDLRELSAKYGFREEEMAEKFVKMLLTELMEEEYESVKSMEESVRMFEYFYKAFRENLGEREELVSFLRGNFGRNLSSSFFLSALYNLETQSLSEIATQLNKYALSVSNLRKSIESEILERSECYTFLNNTTLITQILSNYKNSNNIEKLKLDKMFVQLSESIKTEDKPNCIPHNEIDETEPEGCHDHRDSLDKQLDNLKNLVPNILWLFLGFRLEHSLEFLWAHLTLFNFLSLFSNDLHNELRNDIHHVTALCLGALHGDVTFHSISTNLLTTLICYQVERNLILEFDLKTGDELEEYFKEYGKWEDERSNEYRKIIGDIGENAKSLTHWLALCLKVGEECLKLKETESLTNFGKSVCLLLQHSYLLEPSSYYVNVYVSKLWECRAFYPLISESGVFCNFPNHENVCIIHSFPEEDFFYDLKYCKLDFFKLLYSFNNYSSSEKEELVVGELHEITELNEEEEEEEGEEEDLVVQEIEEANRGYDLMKLYFSTIIGPYLTGQIMRTYVYLDKTELPEIEKCLISWLTVFNTYFKYKNMGNLNCANALLKLLMQKPVEVEEYMNEALQENLAEAIQDEQGEVTDMSFIYDEEFQLQELYPDEYYQRNLQKNSILDTFLQLLILCLEKMLIKDREFCETVKLLYYKVAQIFPMQVSEMWNNCNNSYVKKDIKKFTKHEVTQKLVRDELETIKKVTNDLTVFYDAIKREVTAKLLTKNEITAKITIKVPTAFPLEPLTFQSQENKKNHKWIMYSHSEANRRGIAQGILLWYNNVVKYYQGIEECPICYSIVHAQFQSIPTKICKVCKYKFHKECLFKWFRNAAKAKCPLCQSQVSFL